MGGLEWGGWNPIYKFSIHLETREVQWCPIGAAISDVFPVVFVWLSKKLTSRRPWHLKWLLSIAVGDLAQSLICVLFHPKDVTDVQLGWVRGSVKTSQVLKQPEVLFFQHFYQLTPHVSGYFWKHFYQLTPHSAIFSNIFTIWLHMCQLIGGLNIDAFLRYTMLRMVVDYLLLLKYNSWLALVHEWTSI